MRSAFFEKVTIVSLFEDQRFEYCDTFFIFFEEDRRPGTTAFTNQIADLSNRCIVDRVGDKEEFLETATLRFPADCSAMDLVFVRDEDIATQIDQIQAELRLMTATEESRKKILKMSSCNARYDIFHFEQSDGGKHDFHDPGGLLTLIQRVCSLCDGVGYDPQSQAVL